MNIQHNLIKYFKSEEDTTDWIKIENKLSNNKITEKDVISDFSETVQNYILIAFLN